MTKGGREMEPFLLLVALVLAAVLGVRDMALAQLIFVGVKSVEKAPLPPLLVQAGVAPKRFCFEHRYYSCTLLFFFL